MSSTLSSGVAQAIQVYIKGTVAWFEDSDEAWVSATVISREESATGIKITFENEEDGRKHVFESSYALLEKQKGDNLPPLKNPPKFDNIDDLTNLSYLNEPSVLNTIRVRYFERNIYTYSGIVLIAMNPFFNVQLYKPDIIQKYSGSRRGELEPHLFAIAEDAYRCMVREKSNQTVVVSGESGAGKTVSATHIMRYFATADDQESGKIRDKSQGMTEVEQQIMATNPIMEAFGNAKTTRNNNSSRFGKYIEIQFDNHQNIVGAKIRTYLLERSRLIFQPETERNYHIFYQLCAGASSDIYKKFELANWDKFQYLNQSGTGSIQGVDDAAEFELTQSSLSKVGISNESQEEIFKILAALLHIGNIEITGRTDATLSDSQPSLITVTKLLGIKTAEFKKWLLKRQIVTRSDKIIKNLNPTQATVVRDSVAKYIYACLFDWLVKVINDSLSCQDARQVRTFIGVLDIYGFEHFKKNSFEQFCINYANEKLQQQFNQHVFKLEQEEYVKEKIDWKFIEFSDNQTCIEVIESKLGILALLDEEARMPSGSDQGFCNKLYGTLTNPKYKDYFKKPRFSNNAFIVCHYAHDVEYDCEGFLDKNKDTVPDELLTLLQNADSKFLVSMLQTATAAANAASQEAKPSPVKKMGMGVAKKPTLGSIFKLSLISLMDTINSTNVHYIRCIKPNEAKVAWGFEPNMVLSQLRACGVLETIRISCAGYPSRWTFADFAERFYALVHSKYWYPGLKSDINKLCKIILDGFIKEKDKYQIGLTKIFFRAGQLAYLEKCRRERWDDCAIVIQKHVKRMVARRIYLQKIDLISRLQRVAMQKMGVRKLEMARQEMAAIKIQAEWRCFVQRRRYLQQRSFILRLQAICKSYIARRDFIIYRQHVAAVKIQSLVRGWVMRKKYLVKRDAMLQQRAKSAKQTRDMTNIQPERNVVKPIQTTNYQREEENTYHTKPKAFDTKNEYNSPVDQIRNQDPEIARLHKDLAREKEEMSRLQNANQQLLRSSISSNDTYSNYGDEDITELKNQIIALKAQLSQSLKNYPKRQASVNAYRSMSSQNVQDRLGRSLSILNGKNKKSNGRIVFAQPEQMTPKNNRESVNMDNPEATIRNLLQQNEVLEEELINNLIHSLKFVPPELQKLPALEEVVFPAYVIGKCVTHMWRLGYLVESERLLLRVIDAIQKFCVSFTGEETIVPCSYWLSNSHELLSIVYVVEQELEIKIHHDHTTVSWHDLEKLFSTLKTELHSLQNTIYQHWLSELKKKLDKLVITSIIEYQSLPGFIASESKGFFGKMLSSNDPEQSIDDLLNILNRIFRTMKSYYVKESVIEQAITELLRFIGVNAFNNLIMRRNFNSWKRAMQIQYNVTRLEEWCIAHDLTEALNQLEHLMQAIKLLQLKKSTLDDIKVMYNICWILTPVQIQKLIENYTTAEYEDPITTDILRAIASRVETRDNLLLEKVSVDNSSFIQPEPHNVIRTSYIPNYLNMQHVQRLITISNKRRSQQLNYI